MKYIFLVILFFITSFGNIPAQVPLTFQKCLNAGIQNHPYATDIELISSILQNKIQNLNASRYPQLEMNAQASWQSDVVRIGVELPFPGVEFPVSPKDQYRATLDIRQTIYDGGLSQIQKQVEGVSAGIQSKEAELKIEKVKNMVCNLFYNVLILQENANALSNHLDQLKRNRKIVLTSLQKGIMLPTEVDIINAEIIKLNQKLNEVNNLRQGALEILRLWTGLQVQSDAILVNSDNLFVPDRDVNRMENRLFELQQLKLSEKRKMLDIKKQPYVFAFGQLGYGRPGLNMLNDEFDTYYLMGIGMKWQIWDWNQRRREHTIISIQSELIDNQKNSFNRELETALINQEKLIMNHNGKLAVAEKLLELRKSITGNYSIQLENGVIRAIDFLAVLNEEIQASINYETEKILLQKAISEYLILKGEM